MMRHADALDIDVNLVGKRRIPGKFVVNEPVDIFGLPPVFVAAKRTFDGMRVLHDHRRIVFVADNRSEENLKRRSAPSSPADNQRRFVEVDMRRRNRRNAAVTRQTARTDCPPPVRR
jgi:hypothetical protein